MSRRDAHGPASAPASDLIRPSPVPPGPVPWWAERRHPTRFAALLVLVPVLATVVVGLAADALFPGSDEMVRRLVAVLLVAAAALAVVAQAGAWQRVGAAGPRTWRRTGLLVVPLLVALAPLATGLDLPAAGPLALLVVGYAATGVFEELWHRGVVLDTLRPRGLVRSSLVGGVLFALSHLANIAFGQSVAVSLAQAVGAFCFGVGFGLLRWVTDALWLLAGIHAVGDLMFKITDLHGGLLWGFLVGHDTLMLVWGLVALAIVQRSAGTAS